jgi:hypothetical protein
MVAASRGPIRRTLKKWRKLRGKGRGASRHRVTDHYFFSSIRWLPASTGSNILQDGHFLLAPASQDRVGEAAGKQRTHPPGPHRNDAPAAISWSDVRLPVTSPRPPSKMHAVMSGGTCSQYGETRNGAARTVLSA